MNCPHCNSELSRDQLARLLEADRQAWRRRIIAEKGRRTAREVAKEHGVSRSLISMIWGGKR